MKIKLSIKFRSKGSIGEVDFPIFLEFEKISSVSFEPRVGDEIKFRLYADDIDRDCCECKIEKVYFSLTENGLLPCVLACVESDYYIMYGKEQQAYAREQKIFECKDSMIPCMKKQGFELVDGSLGDFEDFINN